MFNVLYYNSIKSPDKDKNMKQYDATINQNHSTFTSTSSTMFFLAFSKWTLNSVGNTSDVTDVT